MSVLFSFMGFVSKLVEAHITESTQQAAHTLTTAAPVADFSAIGPSVTLNDQAGDAPTSAP